MLNPVLLGIAAFIEIELVFMKVKTILTFVISLGNLNCTDVRNTLEIKASDFEFQSYGQKKNSCKTDIKMLLMLTIMKTELTEARVWIY